MTPEQIAELRARCNRWQEDYDDPSSLTSAIDALGDVLDAIESAQKEIADLKRGGVTAPELTEAMLDLACGPALPPMFGPDAIRYGLRDAARRWYRNGWMDLASHLRTIPADRELGEGRVSVNREWRDLVGQLHMTALDFVNDADPGQRRAAVPLVRAVAALRSYSDAIRAQPTQDAAPKQAATSCDGCFGASFDTRFQCAGCVDHSKYEPKEG